MLDRKHHARRSSGGGLTPSDPRAHIQARPLSRQALLYSRGKRSLTACCLIRWKTYSVEGETAYRMPAYITARRLLKRLLSRARICSWASKEHRMSSFLEARRRASRQSSLIWIWLGSAVCLRRRAGRAVHCFRRDLDGDGGAASRAGGWRRAMPLTWRRAQRRQLERRRRNHRGRASARRRRCGWIRCRERWHAA